MADTFLDMRNVATYYFAESVFDGMQEHAGLAPGQSIEQLTNEAILRLVGAFTLEHAADEATTTIAITNHTVVDSVNDGPQAGKGAASRAAEAIAESIEAEEKDIVIAVFKSVSWWHRVQRVLPPFKTAFLIRHADMGGSRRADITDAMNTFHRLQLPGGWKQRMDPRKLGF